MSVASSQKIEFRSPEGVVTSNRGKSLILGLVLIVSTFVLYYPVTGYPFLSYDDALYVSQNFHVKYGIDMDTVRWAFTSFDAANWHPLTWLSHALDCQLFFLNAGRHHEVNLLLHVLNALLIFWVLREATGFAGRSFMVAALFALHPINVESVAWVAERKNLLSMFFFLLALAAYGWYARKPRVHRYAAIELLFALAIMAKPQVITFPFVLLLWDYWPLQRVSFKHQQSLSPTGFPTRSVPWLILEKVPLLPLSALSAFLTMKAERDANGIGNALNGFPLSARVGNAILSYCRYIGKAFWPSHLSSFYPHPENPLNTWVVVAALIFLLAVTGLVIRARSHRYLAVGWFWFLGTLVPMIGLVQVGEQAMADRYAYLPLVGLFIMVCWGVADFAAHQHISTRLVAAGSAAALLACAAVTHQQIPYWKDDVALWSRAAAVSPENWVVQKNVAVTLLNSGRAEEAMVHLRAAESLSPSNPWVNLFIGYYDQQQHKDTEAVERFKNVLNLTRNDAVHLDNLRITALTHMADAYRAMGDLPDAYTASDEARIETRRAAEAHSKVEKP